MTAPMETMLGRGLARQGLARALAANWWMLLVRGLAAIAFGVMALGWPGLTLATLVLLWGFYAVVDGGAALGLAIGRRDAGAAQRWWLALGGVVGVIAGLAAFVEPALVAVILLWCIGVWAFAVGVLQIYGAFRLRNEIKGEWLLVLSGVVTLGLGLTMFARPGVGALAVVWLIGGFAIAIGLAYVALAFRLRRFKPAD